MTRFLIVGGSGFLGAHLVRRLVGDGEGVAVLDVVAPENAVRLRDVLEKVEYRWGSAQDVKQEQLRPFDVIVYLAAQADVPLALTSPMYTWQANTLGVLHMLEQMYGAGSNQRLIYMSSENVYGKAPDDHIPITEDEALRPVNPYGASKAGADLLCQSYMGPKAVTVLRSTTMYGEGARLKQVIPIFIRQALAGKNITIEGDGSQTRDFNYVGNVVDAIRAAAAYGSPQGVYNIASGEELSIRKIAETIIHEVQARTPTESGLEFRDWRVGEKGLRLALSYDRAKRDLGYEPRVPFRDGIGRTIEWLRSISPPVATRGA